MTVLTFGSVAGAPGTTSLVLALAASWPRDVLVVDADPDGGRLAARCDIAVRPGLTELAAAARSGLADPDDVWRFVQRASNGVDVVPAHPAAEQVLSALRAASPQIADVLGRLADIDVLIDVGRYRPASPASTLAHAADRRLVVTGSRLEDALAVAHRRDLLDGLGGADVIVCADGEHSPGELERAIDRSVIATRPARRSARLGPRATRREQRWVAELAALLATPDPAADHDDLLPDDLAGDDLTEVADVAS